MQLQSTLTNLALAAPFLLAPATSAAALNKRQCQLETHGSGTKPIEDSALCLPQGEGAWTFGMQVDMMSTGLPSCAGTDCDASSDFDNISSSTGLYIFDETCTVRGAYSPDDCSDGIPYTIMENFLPDVLTVTTINMDVGDPYFSFLYSNGEFSIKNNHCVCSDDNAGNTINEATKSCRCAFNVNGEESQ